MASRKRARSFREGEGEGEEEKSLKHQRSEIKQPLTARQQILRKLFELEESKHLPLIPTELKGIMSEYLRGCDELTNRGQMCQTGWYPSNINCSQYCSDNCPAWFLNLLKNTPTFVRFEYFESSESSSPEIVDFPIVKIKFESKGKFQCPGRKPVIYSATFTKYSKGYFHRTKNHITYQIQDVELGGASKIITYSLGEEQLSPVDVEEFCHVVSKHNNLHIELQLIPSPQLDKILGNKSRITLFPEMENPKWLSYSETDQWPRKPPAPGSGGYRVIGASFQMNSDPTAGPNGPVASKSYCLPKWQRVVDAGGKWLDRATSIFS